MIKYTEKRKRNQEVSRFIAAHVSEKTHKRFTDCGNWMEMLANKDRDKLKVHQANFCKNRFCPMCAWRQAEKDALRISVIMEYLAKEEELAFIMVTLTAPNVPGEELSDEVTRYNRAFKKMIERDVITRMNRGCVRKLEITYNKDRNDYHPHFHCIFAVKNNYFKDRSYLSQEKWLNLWRDVMKDESITQVDVRRVKLVGGSDGREGAPIGKWKAINEVAKYAAKDSDYTMSEDVFKTFYEALKGRQVLTYSGVFKDAVALYKAGELDGYKRKDMTEYFYMLLYHWGNGEYIEKECRELTEDEKWLVNGKPMEVDEGINFDD